jgi:hypothetical protein
MSSRAFVAYHSFARMGHEYAGRPGDDFSFRSNKSRQFLERALGNDVWVVEGRRDATGATRYGLAARFVPNEVVEAADGRVVSGEEGEEFDPPVPLSGLAWFDELAAEQENFGLGFSEIKSGRVIAALAEVSAGAIAQPAPSAEATATATPAAASAVPEVAEEPVAPLDNAGRLASWLRQRRGRYFCHHCLSRETGITPVAQVNQALRPLQQMPKEWRLTEAPCGGCGRDRKCIAFVG